MTASALGRASLEKARISSAIALKEETAAQLENSGASASEVQVLRQQIELLKQRQQLLGQKGIAEQAAEDAKQAGEFARQFGLSFSSALEDAIVKGQDLRSVMQGLAQDVLRIAVRKTITEPFGQAVSGLVQRGLQSTSGAAGAASVASAGGSAAQEAAALSSASALTAMTATTTAADASLAALTSAGSSAGASATAMATSLTAVDASILALTTAATGADAGLLAMSATLTAADAALLATSPALAALTTGAASAASALAAAAAAAGGSAAASGASSYGEYAAALFALFAKDGKAFGRSGVQRYARGDVFSSPTVFRFAKGGGFGLGVMGEAGPEAVMPLDRGADGRLGVRFLGGDDSTERRGGNTYVTIENRSGGQVTEHRSQQGGEKFVRIVIDAAVGEMEKRLATGGSTDRVLSQTYGLSRMVPKRR